MVTRLCENLWGELQVSLLIYEFCSKVAVVVPRFIVKMRSLKVLEVALCTDGFQAWKWAVRD